MPKKTTRPMSSILAHKRKELRIVAELNKRGESTIPKKVTIIIRCTTEPTRNVFLLNFTMQEAIPDSPGKNGSKQHFVSFPEMGRNK